MVSEDLGQALIEAVLPERAIRWYPALVSTEATAMAWARAGAPEGSLVVAGYQASPRGRGGKPLELDQESGLAFSLILHPEWPIFREGWLYPVASCALADALGEGASLEWPDEIHRGGRMVAALAVHVEPLGNRLWATVTVLLREASPPRTAILRDAVVAIEARAHEATETVLADYSRRCGTLGRGVRARMVPLGPVGPVFEGRAASVLQDGALVLETSDGRRIAVRPQHLGLLEELTPTLPSA